jgi:hypothetical protein
MLSTRLKRLVDSGIMGESDTGRRLQAGAYLRYAGSKYYVSCGIRYGHRSSNNHAASAGAAA